VAAYAHALTVFGHDWRWLAFIDADEFLFPTEADNLPSVLKDYEHLPALAVFCRMFGFSNHIVRPQGLITECYTMRAPVPPEPDVKPGLLKFKSIVDPSKVRGVETPHRFALADGVAGTYMESGNLVGEGRLGDMSGDRIRLNHYYTKSKQDFALKVSRKAASETSEPARSLFVTERAERIEEHLIEDTAIHRFLPDLKSAMAESPAKQRKPSGSGLA